MLVFWWCDMLEWSRESAKSGRRYNTPVACCSSSMRSRNSTDLMSHLHPFASICFLWIPMLRMPPSPRRRAQGASPGLSATCVGECVGAIVSAGFVASYGFACVCLCGPLLYSWGRRILFFAAWLLKSSYLQRCFLLPLMIYSTKLWVHFPRSFWVCFLALRPSSSLGPHWNALTGVFLSCWKPAKECQRPLDFFWSPFRLPAQEIVTVKWPYCSGLGARLVY